jgi:2',3'-cyclic-nucleotide 2'-phosphodiesterase (5'-nucleotidase family)
MVKWTSVFILLVLIHILPAAETELTIIYSNNTNGMLENCHCPEHAYGALEKRATIIDSVRRMTKNVLVLDAGDLLDIRKNRILHSYVVQAYEIMGYDAWTCGDQDFTEGIDFFDRLAHNPRLPLVCSNVRSDSGTVGVPFLIKNYGQLRIGITGTIDPDLHKYLSEEVQTRYTFTGQKSALQPVLNELLPRCDFIVLISHSGYDQDTELAAWFPMINLIVGGHSQTVLAKADLRGDTYIVQCGENGYRLGILLLHFTGKKLVSLQNKLVLLDAGIDNFPAVMELVNSYHQQILKKKF